jgi:hypothetical protein
MPGKVLEVKSQDSWEAKGIVCGYCGAFQVVTMEISFTGVSRDENTGYIHVNWNNVL